ncbi:MULTISPECIES: cellulose-binding protein [Streptomyces]|uniref:cellulose-binding protein n=1 Tax=Streptomyces TaxID=1883 RepID=UPI001E4C9804|nr:MULTISPECIES: cellulose-binding protein [Streptomyces]UFQ16114.1 cellulose-binding protein [Streptomyces huasconensis]WCL85718.1 cellulose-binding protein [Streptomyces sp. JCM 35825]
MSSSGASSSPHGFTTVRGRGYRPQQVEAYAAGLSEERDEAWERAARLTVLAKDMEAEAAHLREVVSRLAPQTYETLGGRARQILALAREEADAVREAARDEAQAVVEAAEAAAREVREAARVYAEEVGAQADEWVGRRLREDRGAADEARISARRDVKEWRGAALAVLRETRRRCEALLAEQEKEQAGRWEAAERELTEREAAADARDAELIAAAEARLSEAERAFAEAEEAARHKREDAQAWAAEIVAEARLREERIARETERVLREHGEEWDEVRAHMDHVRGSLAALTGRAPAEEAP